MLVPRGRGGGGREELSLAVSHPQRGQLFFIAPLGADSLHGSLPGTQN